LRSYQASPVAALYCCTALVRAQGPTQGAMTGAEIVAASKAVEVVGKKMLAEDDKMKDVLVRRAEDTPEMRVAARSMAARAAVMERMKLNFLRPVARMFGVGREYFEDKFLEEMSVKVAEIPEENIITPSPVVAMPVFQGLSYSLLSTNRVVTVTELLM
jgi:hypothetical protein